MLCFVHIWIPVLGLVVSAVGLIVVIKYTAITARLEAAAQEQIEATRKPVIVLLFDIRSDDVDLVFERIEGQPIPQAAMLRVSQTSGNFLFSNIGTGPALNLAVDFGPVDPKLGDPNRYSRKYPFLPPGAAADAPIGWGNSLGDDFKFTAKYESLSGRKYSTEMPLHARSARTIVLRGEWTFKRIDEGRARRWTSFWRRGR